MYDLVEFGLVAGWLEDDVVFDCRWDNPWFLGCVRDAAVDLYFGLVCRYHLVEDGEEETRFATAYISNYYGEVWFFDGCVDVFEYSHVIGFMMVLMR